MTKKLQPVVPVNRDKPEQLAPLNQTTPGRDSRFLPRREQSIVSTYLPPARMYEYIQGGPNWIRTYETQTGVPIEGSKPGLRDPRFGSPFTFRIIPPELLIDSILEGSESDTSTKIIDSVQRADTSFRSYVKRLDTLRTHSRFVTSRSSLNTIQSFISEGQLIDSGNVDDPANVYPAVSDLRKASDVIFQLTRMAQAPPLTLLVNPQSISIAHQKKHNYTERSRYNYIFTSWGEEQVRLSVSGLIGAFIAGDPPHQIFVRRGRNARTITETASASGVQWASRRDSAAWQNLMNLYLFYRNNGYIYDTVEGSEAHLWIGSVAIDYDQWTYVGNFNSFDFQFSDDKQHGMIPFNFEFVASRIFDNAQRSLFVEPIESPVPSPSDYQWSIPKKRQRGSTSIWEVGGKKFKRSGTKLQPTSEGVFPPDLPIAASGRRSPGMRNRTGLVRGGEL